MISTVTFWAMVGLAVAVVGIAGFFVWRSVEEDYEQVRVIRAYLFRVDSSIVIGCQRCVYGTLFIGAKARRGVYDHLPVVLAELGTLGARVCRHQLKRTALGKRRERRRQALASGQSTSPYMRGLVTHQRQVRRENGYHTPYDGSGVDQHGSV